MSADDDRSPQRDREHADPDERNRPLPWFLTMGLGAMAMWGAFYIVATPSGESSAYGDQRTISELRPPDPTATVAAAVDGRQVYSARCAACHQATGLGVAGVFPPLAGAEWVTGSEVVLTRLMLHGIEGEIVVKGNTYNGVMPAWKSLGDDELAAVMSYIRGAWGNQAPPVSAETVRREREATQDRTGPYQGGDELLGEV